MSQTEDQRILEQLHAPDEDTRIRTIRRLAAIADLESVPDLVKIYADPQEPPAVRHAVREALGVFKAIQVAVKKGQAVELPDPDSVPHLRDVTGTFRRLRTGLVIALVLVIALNAGVFILKRNAQALPPREPRLMVAEMRFALDQLRADITNQQAAWNQYQAIQTLGCDRLAPPAAISTSTGWIEGMGITQAAHPELYDAALVFTRAINRFTLVANEWSLGCANQPTGGAEANLAQLAAISDETTLIQSALARAEAALPTPEATPRLGPGGEVLATIDPSGIPVTLPPTVPPTPLAMSVDRYGAYIRAMRERVDGAALGRGVVAQLNQYWQDIRTGGQTFGCGQMLPDDNVANYVGLTAEDAALDPRLNDIQVAINVGMTLARESLTNFRQACNAGNFSTLVEMGQPQAQQALAALNQASLLLDQLQTEIRQAPQ